MAMLANPERLAWEAIAEALRPKSPDEEQEYQARIAAELAPAERRVIADALRPAEPST